MTVGSFHSRVTSVSSWFLAFKFKGAFGSDEGKLVHENIVKPNLWIQINIGNKSDHHLVFLQRAKFVLLQVDKVNLDIIFIPELLLSM